MSRNRRRRGLSRQKRKHRPGCATTRDGQVKKYLQAHLRAESEKCQAMELIFKYVKDTKTCHVFESGAKPEFTTLYLKKSQVEAASIDPKNGITVTIEETK